MKRILSGVGRRSAETDTTVVVLVALLLVLLLAVGGGGGMAFLYWKQAVQAERQATEAAYRQMILADQQLQAVEQAREAQKVLNDSLRLLQREEQTARHSRQAGRLVTAPVQGPWPLLAQLALEEPDRP